MLFLLFLTLCHLKGTSIILKDNRAIFHKPQNSKSFYHFEIGLKSIIKCGENINEDKMCRNILVSETEGVQIRVCCKK